MNDLKQAMAKVIYNAPKNFNLHEQALGEAQAILDMPEIKQALQNTASLNGGIRQRSEASASDCTSPASGMGLPNSSDGGVIYCAYDTANGEYPSCLVFMRKFSDGRIKVIDYLYGELADYVHELASHTYTHEQVQKLVDTSERLRQHVSATCDYLRVAEDLEAYREALAPFKGV